MHDMKTFKKKPFSIKPIRNERDYKSALKHIEAIFDAKHNTDDANTLEILTTLVERYEEENYTIDFPDPIELIKFKIEHMQTDVRTLTKIFGSRGRYSEFMNKRRGLPLNIIRKLNSKLDIPLEVLVKDYKLHPYKSSKTSS